jgi:phage shock protein C
MEDQMKRGRTFYLDKRNGKVMGVCAGIADYTGWDATFVRIGVVLVTLLGAFPWTVIAYGLVAWLAKSRPQGLYQGEDYAMPRGSARDLRESLSDIDRRMAEVDSFVANSNSRLAHEIDSLR